MNKFLIASAAVAALAIPALANAASGTVNISGLVAPNCAFTTVGTPTISAGELANSATGAYNGALDTATHATVTGFCNGVNALIHVQANPVTTGTAIGVGFTNTINYIATATLTNATPATVTATDDSAIAGAGSDSALGLFTGNIDIGLSGSTASGGLKPVAGTYAGTTVVTLTPGA